MCSTLEIILIVMGVLIAWGIILLFIIGYIAAVIQKDERQKKDNDSDCFEGTIEEKSDD